MRVPTPSGMSAREWANLLPADRLNAMFSAYVEDARLMQALHDLLDYCMRRGATASEFIRLARDWMERNDFVFKGKRIDIDHPELTQEETQRYQRDVRNIDSSARLRLIYDTNVRQCYGLASWSRQAMPPLIQAFPAYRFVRFPGARVKRLRHEVGEGDVRLKTDYEYWARYQNSKDIGGFEVPWAPFGYNSYMQLQPVSRKECEQLGLLKPGEVVMPERGTAFGLNLEEDYKRGKGQASTRKMSPEVRQVLLDKLRNANISVIVDGERIALKAATVPPPEAAVKSLVSDKIPYDSTPGLTRKVRQALKDANKAIDSVHWDGPLPVVSLEQSRSASVTGSFNPFSDIPIITISKSGSNTAFTVIHEQGHFIDLYGLGKGRCDMLRANKIGIEAEKRSRYASEHDDDLKELMDAIMSTPTLQAIQAEAGSYYRYLESRRECFARAYAQFIALESGNRNLLRMLVKGKIQNHYTQWTIHEFRAIRKAFRDLFRKKGWMN